MAARVAAIRSSSGLIGVPRCSNGMLDRPVNTAICKACSRATWGGSTERVGTRRYRQFRAVLDEIARVG